MTRFGCANLGQGAGEIKWPVVRFFMAVLAIVSNRPNPSKLPEGVIRGPTEGFAAGGWRKLARPRRGCPFIVITCAEEFYWWSHF
jgi:hypothetical protein